MTHQLSREDVRIFGATASCVVLAALAATGCVARPGTAPNPPPRSPSDAGITMLDASVSVGDEPVLLLDVVPSRTRWESIPISGRGPADGVVVVEREDGSTEVGAIDRSGNFCLELALIYEGENLLVAYAQDAEGTFSESVEFTVSLDYQPEEEEEQPEEVPMGENLALGGVVKLGDDDHTFTTVTEAEGSFAALTDGDLGTYVRLQNVPYDFTGDWEFDEIPDVVFIDLARTGWISQVTIHASPECSPKTYIVSLFNGETGTKAWRVTNGGMSVTIPVGNELASRIAIYFEESGCSSTLGFGENELREIEVWSTPPVIQTEERETGPTCANR